MNRVVLSPVASLAPTATGDQPARRRRQQGIIRLLEQAWGRGWLSRPTLDPDELINAARRLTGHDDFGLDRCWRDRLYVLADALHAEAELNPLGRVIAHGELLSALMNRLRARALWRRHPEILDIAIQAPVIVVGQMRSGTTRMQRLLACDPRLDFTRFYESWNPVPLRADGLDDRLPRGWLALAVAKLINPDFATIHPTHARQADEEIGFHNISIFASAFEAQWRVPSFSTYVENSDPTLVYAEFRRLLQTTAWLRGRPAHRPWVLKVPQFCQDLDAVLAAFPDARLVFLKRDPARVIASSASLVRNQMAVQSDHVDPRWIGREWLRKVALREERMAAVRRRNAAPSVEVDYERMRADWRREMRRVYRMLEMPFTREVEQRMAAYLGQKQHRRLAGHRYTLGEFGLSERDIREALARLSQPELAVA